VCGFSDFEWLSCILYYRYVVENKVLVGALRSRLQVSASVRGCMCLYPNRSALFSKEPDGLGLQSTGTVEFICPAQVKSVLFPSQSGSDSDARQELAEVGLGDGRCLRTRLVVRSMIRPGRLCLLNVELCTPLDLFFVCVRSLLPL